MKHLLLIPIFLLSLIVKSQTVVEYDRMETTSTGYATAGWWIGAASAGWFTNASVSPDYSAAIYGLGAGTSAYELDYYVLPNVVLNPANQYQLKFNLASYTFSNSTATTRGVDIGDYIEVRLSTDGGFTYTTELRITGNNNSRWSYTSSGVVNHTANGSFTNSAAPAGDVYTAPVGLNTTGPSVIMLNLPTGISQVAIDLFCRANAAGEEWWFDNIELLNISGTELPIELVSFNGKSHNNTNLLYWTTATEHNNNYFTLERSTNGSNWDIVESIMGANNSQTEINYSHIDRNFEVGKINYYRLSQTDFDGTTKFFNVVAIDNTNQEKIVNKILNVNGQVIDEINDHGIYILVYEDGTMKKIIR